MSRIQLSNLPETKVSSSFLIDLLSTEAHAINGGFFFFRKRRGSATPVGGSPTTAPVYTPPAPEPEPPVVVSEPEPVHAAPAPEPAPHCS